MNRRIFVFERKLPQLTVELFTRHLTHQGRKFVIQNRVRMTTVILGERDISGGDLQILGSLWH